MKDRLTQRVPITPTLTARLMDTFLTQPGGVAIWAGFVFGAGLALSTDFFSYLARSYRRISAKR